MRQNLTERAGPTGRITSEYAVIHSESVASDMKHDRLWLGSQTCPRCRQVVSGCGPFNVSWRASVDELSL